MQSTFQKLKSSAKSCLSLWGVKRLHVVKANEVCILRVGKWSGVQATRMMTFCNTFHSKKVHVITYKIVNNYFLLVKWRNIVSRNACFNRFKQNLDKDSRACSSPNIASYENCVSGRGLSFFWPAVNCLLQNCNTMFHYRMLFPYLYAPFAIQWFFLQRFYVQVFITISEVWTQRERSLVHVLWSGY